MKSLQKHFDELYDCVVEALNYDYLNAKVIMLLKDLETNTIHNICFNDVDSCLFTMMGCDGKICKNICPEVSSILTSLISVKTDNKWLGEYPLRYNVCIEVMDRAILINTRSVEIDSDVFVEPFE